MSWGIKLSPQIEGKRLWFVGRFARHFALIGGTGVWGCSPHSKTDILTGAAGARWPSGYLT
jgi:hypothetical protein